jgi:hypothetical protein
MNTNDQIRELQNLTLQLLCEHISPNTSSNYSFVQQDREKLKMMMERFKGDEFKTRQLTFLSLKKLLKYDLFYFVIPPSTKPFYNPSSIDDSTLKRILQLMRRGENLRVRWWDEELPEKTKNEIKDMLRTILYNA